MPLPSPKELKKIADSCRKAGIAYFKCADFEFTLSPQAQSTPTAKRSDNTKLVDNTSTYQDRPELTDDELLLWSSGGLAETAS